MWPVLIILIVIVLVLYLIEYSIHNCKAGKLFDKIPGPETLPVIGNILDFLYGPVPVFYQKRGCANRFKKIYREYAGPFRVINLYTPEDIEIVLSSQKYINKGMLYDTLRPWLKEGLLTSAGDKWHKRRRILTPAFHFNILKEFCKTFAEQSSQFVKKVKAEIGENETSIVPIVAQFALNTISETAMGLRIESKQTATEKYKKAIYEIGEILLYRLVRVWLQADFIFKMTSVAQKQKEIISTLHQFTTDVIRERRKTVSVSDLKGIANETYDEDDYTRIKKTRMAMLDLLLLAESEGSINEHEVREEVDTFMFEGHDTTTMAISFCLMLLANNKAEQEQARAEIDEIFADSNEPLTIEDLSKMKYLERCIKEALRLYPSVPFIGRHILEEVQLKDYLIPADTIYEIHIFDLHRNPRIYHSPNVFEPDRFLKENCAKRHPYAYIPFSAGPRNCIGQKFAMLEEKSLISSILRNFILEPITTPEDIIFSADLVLRSKDPMMIKFIPRNFENI